MQYSARYALSIAAAAIVAGCGGSQSPLSAPGAISRSAAIARTGAIAHAKGSSPSYRVVYSFGAIPYDGTFPLGGLIDVNGALYGTTGLGGTYQHGTVFSISASGAEHVLYNFGASSNDGEVPGASLLNVNGTLYGTTYYGGKYGGGTVFSITATGEHLLHSFGKGSDGVTPVSRLINVKGTLYGTTQYGGAGPCSTYGNNGCGTVYTVSTGGKEHVLHSFDNNGVDGYYPQAGLIDVKGTLYGTTLAGGACSGSSPCGTVFKITTGGTEKVLHTFGTGLDGVWPRAGLINVKGTLYGTTSTGGKDFVDGTVFSISHGTERVVYSFTGAPDGYDPQASLRNVGGTLYGTTWYGGEYNYGTVFSVSTNGVEQVLHSFNNNGSDGEYPPGELVNVNGALYGLTNDGGTYNEGTVFALTP